MKLLSTLFTDAMKYNRILIENNLMIVQNYDGSSTMIESMHDIANPDNEKMEFVINEKDYKFISKLGFIELKLTKNDLRITSNGSNKYKFALLKEYTTPNFDVSNMNVLDISYDDLKKASAFTGAFAANTATPQYTGINILNEVMLATNRAAVFRKKIDNQSKHEINIPKDVMKFIDDQEDLEFKTNGKFLSCKTSNKLIITNLINQKLKNNKINLAVKYDFKIVKKDLIDSLKLINEYEDVVKFRCDDRCLNLIAQNSEHEFDMNVEISSVHGEPFDLHFSVKNLLIILNAIEVVDLTIEISDIALRIYDESKEIEFILPKYLV